MAQEAFQDILSKRKDKILAVLLGVKEREIDQFIPPETRVKYRKIVLDQINDYYSLCLDLIESIDTGEYMYNELLLRQIEEIHNATVGNGSSA